MLDSVIVNYQLINFNLQLGETDMMEAAMNSEQLSNRLLDFAVRVSKVVDALPKTRLGNQIATQLVRSGTAPVPNYQEACAAESRPDFVHKLSICLKELRETHAWLQLAGRAELLQGQRIDSLIDECSQLCRIIAKSRLTAKAITATPRT